MIKIRASTAVALHVLLMATLFMFVIGCSQGGDGGAPVQQRIPTATPGPIVVANINARIDIASGQAYRYNIYLSPGQRVEGTALLRGSGVDIGFFVVDPNGNTVVSGGRISGSRGFAFIAATSGSYALVFDNTYSVFVSKAVDVTGTVWSR